MFYIAVGVKPTQVLLLLLKAPRRYSGDSGGGFSTAFSSLLFLFFSFLSNEFLRESSSSLAMTLAFLCRPAVATSFLAGFVRNRVTVLSQTLQLAPRVLTLPRVRAGSAGLETYLGRPIKWAVPWTSFPPMHNFKLYCTQIEFLKERK